MRVQQAAAPRRLPQEAQLAMNERLLPLPLPCSATWPAWRAPPSAASSVRRPSRVRADAGGQGFDSGWPCTAHLPPLAVPVVRIQSLLLRLAAGSLASPFSTPAPRSPRPQRTGTPAASSPARQQPRSRLSHEALVAPVPDLPKPAPLVPTHDACLSFPNLCACAPVCLVSIFAVPAWSSNTHLFCC